LDNEIQNEPYYGFVLMPFALYQNPALSRRPHGHI